MIDSCHKQAGVNPTMNPETIDEGAKKIPMAERNNGQSVKLSDAFSVNPANGNIISHRLDAMAKGAVNCQVVAGRIILELVFLWYVD